MGLADLAIGGGRGRDLERDATIDRERACTDEFAFLASVAAFFAYALIRAASIGVRSAERGGDYGGREAAGGS